MKFAIVARGHENIRATHRTTLEVTKDEELTPRGDCIIGVAASASASELPEELKAVLRRGVMVRISIALPDYGLRDDLVAYGSPKLILDHSSDIVVRRSDYVCGRTVAIKASKAARDINREIVELLKDKRTELILEISPEV